VQKNIVAMDTVNNVNFFIDFRYLGVTVLGLPLTLPFHQPNKDTLFSWEEAYILSPQSLLSSHKHL